MNILVLNGSPAGQASITLQTVLYIQQFYEQYPFEVLDVGQRIKQYEKDFGECRKKIDAADLIIFAYPVYTFLIPAQLHRFIEMMKEENIDYTGKYATQITTSKHFYDVTAHRFIQDNCDDMGLAYIKGLSADMEDLLHKKGQDEALSFFQYVLWSYQHGYHEPVLYREKKEWNGIETTIPDKEVIPKRGKIAVVTDTEEGSPLSRMIQRLQYNTSFETVVVNLRDFPFSGGCLGCFHCASTGECIYKDGFDAYLRNKIQTTDATVYAFTIQDHGMGYRFKLFDDRQFCNGHRTVTMGKPVGYLIDGDLDDEPNLRMVIEARADTGGNYLAGIATNKKNPDHEIDRLADTLRYAVEKNYRQPQMFYGVGGLKIFRDLIYEMQGMMKEDHRFYKEHGFYDFPQKKKGMILGMYLVGEMMTNPKLSKKLGGKMTEGMLMPYQQVIKKAKKKMGNL